MSIKGWLHKSNTKAAASAEGFLQAHRSFLETGELASITTPILKMVDEGALFPTPALELLQAEVLAYIVQADAAKAANRIAESAEGESIASVTRKSWTATVYNAKGEVQTVSWEENVEVLSPTGERVTKKVTKTKDLRQSFDLCADADRWSDRRLFDGASDWFATVEHSTMLRADGTAISTTIMRQDSIARILKQKKQPFAKKTGSRDSKLSWGAKVSQSRAHFSRG